MSKELTMKQREWLQSYMETGNATRSALIAYYPDFPIEKAHADLSPEEKGIYNGAASVGWENLRKLEIEIKDLMDEAGLTDAFLIKKLNEQLEATRLYGKNNLEHMDGSTRNKALEMAFKLKGKLKDKVELEGGFFSTNKLEEEVIDESQTEQEATLNFETLEPSPDS